MFNSIIGKLEILFVLQLKSAYHLITNPLTLISFTTYIALEELNLKAKAV